MFQNKSIQTAIKIPGVFLCAKKFNEDGPNGTIYNRGHQSWICDTCLCACINPCDYCLNLEEIVGRKLFDAVHGHVCESMFDAQRLFHILLSGARDGMLSRPNDRPSHSAGFLLEFTVS